MKVLSDELQEAIFAVLRAYYAATLTSDAMAKLHADYPELQKTLWQLDRVSSGNAAR
jgi:hypothetical protein